MAVKVAKAITAPKKRGRTVGASSLTAAHLRGKGDYFSDVGSWLGGKAGHLVGSLFGHGDYGPGNSGGIHSGDKPAVNSMVQGTQVPEVSSSKGGSVSETIRIRHREFVGVVQSSADFASTSFKFQPGLLSTFPWLALIASRYTEWQPLGAVLSYVPRVSPLSTEASGAVTLVAQYNVNLPDYTSDADAQNAMYAATGRPMDGLMMGIECDPGQRVTKTLKIRNGSVGSDPLTLYDLANLQVCVSGCSSAGTDIGQVYISYEIEFLKPTTLTTSSLAFGNGYALTGTGTHGDGITPFGGATVVTPLGVESYFKTPVSGTAMKFSLPAGTFIAVLSVAVDASFIFTGSSNLALAATGTGVTNHRDGHQSITSDAVGIGQFSAALTFAVSGATDVTITAAGFSGGSLPTYGGSGTANYTNSFFYLIPVPSGLVVPPTRSQALRSTEAVASNLATALLRHDPAVMRFVNALRDEIKGDSPTPAPLAAAPHVTFCPTCNDTVEHCFPVKDDRRHIAFCQACNTEVAHAPPSPRSGFEIVTEPSRCAQLSMRMAGVPCPMPRAGK